MSGATFTLNINNQTGGAITYNGFTDGVGSPPISEGNPPLLNGYIPAGGTTNNVVQVAGGSYYDSGDQQTVYQNTVGQVTFNLPDASVLTVYWDVSYYDGATFNTPTITSPTSYEVIPSPSGSTLTITVQPQS